MNKKYIYVNINKNLYFINVEKLEKLYSYNENNILLGTDNKLYLNDGLKNKEVIKLNNNRNKKGVLIVFKEMSNYAFFIDKIETVISLKELKIIENNKTSIEYKNKIYQLLNESDIKELYDRK